MSRPVTASDYRESPEVRETTFEPILKDLQKQTLPLPSTLTTSQPSSLSSQKKRPPTTTIRFSPQMEEKLTPAHELSTIVEVETPVASKINILEDERVDLTKESIQYENFPDYEDYLKKVERQTAGDLQKLFEVSQLKYKEFVQPAVYGIEDSLAKTKEDDEGNSSDSSIDIVAELKKRNIITRSFENLSSSGDESDGPATKEPKDQLDSLLNSPKKPARQNPEIRILESSRILPSPPTSPEKKQQKPAVQKSPRKNKEAPKSDSPRLEDDLTDMGMPWMTSMLKRNQESNTIQSSSSSASVSIGNNQEKQEQNPNRPGKLISRKTYEIEVRDPNSSSPTTNSSTDTTSSGKPLNLRDFLRRELTIRSENKNLTNESSLSSKFMQSLLNATGTSSSNSGMQSQDVKLRTSTPVQLDSTRLGASLFSADSRMSSVRMSSSGEDKKSPS